jgi:hypothetical protein
MYLIFYNDYSHYAFLMSDGLPFAYRKLFQAGSYISPHLFDLWLNKIAKAHLVLSMSHSFLREAL